LIGPGRICYEHAMAGIIQRATTIILVRDENPEEFEVYLLKRHEKSSFMAGNYVYPGGRIDPNDQSLEICPYTRGVSPEEAMRILTTGLSPEESLACWTSAIRELFEEAGVIFGCNRGGDLLSLGDSEEKKRYDGYRKEVQKGSMTLCEVAQREQILIALDQLHYYARWITPEARPQRFDTYFFIARHPRGQEATPDQKETTVGIWITPAQALKENLAGEVALSPPTLKTIEDLSRYRTLDEVFRSLKNRVIQPILPHLTKVSNETAILFPWDPEYERFKRGEIPNPVDHGKPSELTDNTTRVILRNGRWLPHHKKA